MATKPLSMKMPELYRVSAPSLSQNTVCGIIVSSLVCVWVCFIYVYVYTQMYECVCLEAGGSTLGVTTEMPSTLLGFFWGEGYSLS